MLTFDHILYDVHKLIQNNSTPKTKNTRNTKPPQHIGL